jgi:hypothetical protein
MSSRAGGEQVEEYGDVMQDGGQNVELRLGDGDGSCMFRLS